MLKGKSKESTKYLVHSSSSTRADLLWPGCSTSNMEETSNVEAARHETNIEEKNHETNIENHNKLPRSFNGGKKLGECFAETRRKNIGAC